MEHPVFIMLRHYVAFGKKVLILMHTPKFSEFISAVTLSANLTSRTPVNEDRMYDCECRFKLILPTMIDTTK